MALADTLFLLDLMRGRERAVAMLEALEDEGEAILLAAPTLAEFHRGLGTLALPAAQQRRLVEAVHGRVVLPLDAAAARRAGEVDAQLWARGEAIDPEDAALAGIALTRDQVLVTRKARELGRVPGLRLRTY
ncbi:MAG: tRNA(fMet)-specific endonuclease VapC [Thermoplasmata archaeon]|jgi:predicted nucleic acid-binding protein|nr:tRNA(fMet)-specific endonuclease VapC [Thermoplasmata archaeon]